MPRSLPSRAARSPYAIIYDKAGLSYIDPQTRGAKVKNDFYIDEVDAEAGTFVMNYNPETKGRVLTFTVTLVSVA